MANQEQVKRLRKNIEDWNKWRRTHRMVQLDLSNADLSNADLRSATLNKADLSRAYLNGTNLSRAYLNGTNLSRAYLNGADLSVANLSRANLSNSKLSNSKLSDTNLSNADLRNATLSNANLSRAYLNGADLSNADLNGTNLSNVNLNGTNLSNADLNGAKLNGAFLNNANLNGANLNEVNLSDAELSNVDLSNANLNGANLSNASIRWTSFGDRDFRVIKGLETINHRGPSPLSINSLYLSGGAIHEHFLRGTGAPDIFIEYVKSLTSHTIEYYTCFISYSSKDEEFAKRLYADLQSNGVRCWFAPHSMRPGTVITRGIDEAIRLYDKLLLILSQHSVESTWVEFEVAAALEKEKEQKNETLFPIRLDDTVLATKQAWAAGIRRQRHIGNFTQWKDQDTYQQVFNRLLRDLKTSVAKERQ